MGGEEGGSDGRTNMRGQKMGRQTCKDKRREKTNMRGQKMGRRIGRRGEENRGEKVNRDI